MYLVFRLIDFNNNFALMDVYPFKCASLFYNNLCLVSYPVKKKEKLINYYHHKQNYLKNDMVIIVQSNI